MRRLALLALLVVCSASFLVAQPGNVTIKGKIDGVRKGRLYLLARSSEENTDTLGFCDFRRGRFELEAAIDEPLVTQLMLEGFSGGFTLFAEPGVEYSAFLSEDDSYYIRGGVLNDGYAAYMKSADSLRVIISDLQQRYDTLRAEMKYRSASRVNDTLRYEQGVLRELTDAYLSNNDNVISSYTIYSNMVMRDAGLEETRRLYSALGEGARASQYGSIIRERILRLEATAGGAEAPDFTLPDINGSPVTMSEVCGKIKIIDFWASWCGPCRLNNPALRALYDEYHDKGLEIIGVSLDTDKEAWASAVEKDGLIWVNVSSLKGWECELIHLYNITGVPSLFILDANNRIIATGLRGEQLKNFIQERLIDM